MPDLSQGTQIVMPTSGTTQSYALSDFEMAKFSWQNGTVSVNTNLRYSGTGGTVDQVGTANPLPVTLQTLVAGENLTADVLGVQPKPVAASAYAPSEHTNFGAAAGTGVLIKNTAGNVYAFDVTSATTAVRYFQLFNQATVPVVGQTPVASYPMGSVAAGNIYRLQVSSSDLAPSKYFATGIAAAISSTNGTLGTASITAADYSWHIKYV